MVRIGVISFPGSNCESETIRAAERAGAEPVSLWHKDTDLKGADVVILPGGFSYGDYLRTGAIARFSPIMEAVRSYADAGGPVLGICNGFQILCEAGLLPGALVRNGDLFYHARPVDVRIERTDTPFTNGYRAGQVIRIPMAHGEGRYVAPVEVLETLDADGLVALRYVSGRMLDAPGNPNDATADIAGICNPAGNVMGIMPHPERLADPNLGSDAGLGLFHSIVSSLSAAQANRGFS